MPCAFTHHTPYISIIPYTHCTQATAHTYTHIHTYIYAYTYTHRTHIYTQTPHTINTIHTDHILYICTHTHIHTIHIKYYTHMINKCKKIRLIIRHLVTFEIEIDMG